MASDFRVQLAKISYLNVIHSEQKLENNIHWSFTMSEPLVVYAPELSFPLTSSATYIFPQD